MKKQEKIDLIQKSVDEIEICRCYFIYDPNYYYYCPNAVNEKFILGQEENDFSLDGYCIRKISHLKKVEIKDDKCNEINKLFGITNQLSAPCVDIGSWRSIFESLSKLDVFIEIQDELNDQYAIGVITKVLKDRLYFKSFDADGEWDEEGFEIRYSSITSVKWGTRYAEYWKRYFELKEKNKEE